MGEYCLHWRKHSTQSNHKDRNIFLGPNNNTQRSRNSKLTPPIHYTHLTTKTFATTNTQTDKNATKEKGYLNIHCNRSWTETKQWTNYLQTSLLFCHCQPHQSQNPAAKYFNQNHLQTGHIEWITNYSSEEIFLKKQKQDEKYLLTSR